MRREERRKGKRSARGQRSVPWFTLLVVGVVVVFGFLFLRAQGVFDAAPIGASVIPGQVEANVGQKVDIQGSGHLTAGQRFTSYSTTPPSSGPHDQSTLPYGVYSSPVSDERMVHSLEHGAIFIGYNGLSAADEAQLKAIPRRWPAGPFGTVKIIVAPYPRLDQGTIALTAWGYIDKMQQYDERRILGFIKAHIEQGPERAP